MVEGFPNADCESESYTLCFEATQSAWKDLSDAQFGNWYSCNCLEYLETLFTLDRDLMCVVIIRIWDIFYQKVRNLIYHWWVGWRCSIKVKVVIFFELTRMVVWELVIEFVFGGFWFEGKVLVTRYEGRDCRICVVLLDVRRRLVWCNCCLFLSENGIVSWWVLVSRVVTWGMFSRTKTLLLGESCNTPIEE